MKKKNCFLLAGAVVLSLGCISLASCNNDDPDEKKGNEGELSVKLNGLDAYYLPDDYSIDWDKVTLTVTYPDKTVNELTSGKFDVEPSELSGIQEFILDTGGLYTNSVNGNTIPEGTYDIYYYVLSNEPNDDTVYTGLATSVVVTEYPSELYDVENWEEPAFLSTYKYNLTRIDDGSVTGTEEESLFYEEPGTYTVGDDNPFILQPSLELVSKEGGNHLFPDNYPSEATVTHNGVTLDIENNSYVSYSNFGFDFSEEAIGETFTISVAPKYFDRDSFGYRISPISMEVEVQDGWNVYSALDLGRINLVDPDFKYEEWIEYYESPYTLFWSQDESTAASVYEKRVYHKIWEEFLTSKGQSDFNLVNGIFLHNDIVITNDDIPEDLIITEAEASTFSVNYDDMVGSIRDGVIIYNHLMEDDFTINGNLFEIDASNLKWDMTRETFSNENPLTYYSQSGDVTVTEGNSSLFCFDDAVENTYFSELPNNGDSGFFHRPDDWPHYTATMKNVETIGNMNRHWGTETDNDTQLAAGCLTFVKSTGSATVIDNSIIKEYLVAGYAEKTPSDAAYECLEMNHLKVYDCYGCAFVVWCSGSSVIDNSEVKRLGGPIVLIESAKASVESGEDGYNQGFQMSGFTIGDNVTIENPLGGTEAWFQIYNLTSYMTLLDTFIEPLFSGGSVYSIASTDGVGKTLYNDGKFSLVVAGMDRYVTRDYDLYIDFGYEGEEFKYDAGFVLDEENLDPENLSFNEIISLFYNDSDTTHGYSLIGLNYFPVFKTNTGTVFSLGINWTITNVLPSSIYLFDVGEYYKDKLSDSTQTISTADYKLESLSEDDNFVYFYLNFNGVILTLGFELYDYTAPEEGDGDTGN